MKRSGFLLLAVGVSLGACSGPQLLDERRALPHAALLEQGDALRRSGCHVLASEPGAEPLRVAVEYVPAREAPAGHLLVLVNGVFSSRTSWRFLVGPLAQGHDVLLVDPPGCGESDKPHPRWAGADAYTPAWIAKHVARAAEAWSSSRGNTLPVALVGHSLGASTVLRMLSEPGLVAHAPGFLRRVDRVVLIACPDVVVEEVPPTLDTPATVTGVEIDLARVIGLYGRGVEEGVWEASHDPCRTAFRRDAEDMKQAIGWCSTRLASQAMLARYNPTLPDGSIDRRREAVLRGNLRRVRTPALVMQGEHDDTLSLDNSRRLVAALPNARFVVVPCAKHSPHAERASEVADAILRFLGD